MDESVLLEEARFRIGEGVAAGVEFAGYFEESKKRAMAMEARWRVEGRGPMGDDDGWMSEMGEEWSQYANDVAAHSAAFRMPMERGLAALMLAVQANRDGVDDELLGKMLLSARAAVGEVVAALRVRTQEDARAPVIHLPDQDWADEPGMEEKLAVVRAMNEVAQRSNRVFDAALEDAYKVSALLASAEALLDGPDRAR